MLLGERFVVEDDSRVDDCSSKNTDSIELRENNCELTKSNPKHNNPKVSAVSWIIKRALRVYACCQKVKEKGAWKDNDVNET